MESVAALNSWMLMATLVFAALTGAFVFMTTGKVRELVKQLTDELEASRKRGRSLEKTAEGIRKELLQTQQHQDISQLKLKTSKTSTQELRQELLDARKRLEIAEAAVKAHQEQGDDTETLESFDLELEPEGGLSESQREQLIDLLDPGPKGNVDIFCVMGNDTSELTADHLDEILTADGWKTNGVAQSAYANPPGGLVLAVNSKETAPSYASFLQRVFSTIGMEVNAKIDTKYREWSLTIIVGTFDG
jgi:TolA-binding protein